MSSAISYNSAPGTLQFAGSAINYTFCYPNLGTAPFFVGLDSKISQPMDAEILKALFRSSQYKAFEAKDLPAALPSGLRFYDVSEYMPAYMREKLGTSAYVPGPNCYHVVMSNFYGDRFKDRYVHDEEIAYYLTRDFRSEPQGGDIFGSALIFVDKGYAATDVSMGLLSGDEAVRFGLTPFGIYAPALPAVRRPSRIPRDLGSAHVHMSDPGLRRAPEVDDLFFMDGAAGDFFTLAGDPFPKIIRGIDPGVHGALNLIAGMVFQKGCYGEFCGYRIVPFSKAMSSIEMKRDRFEPPPKPENDAHFRAVYYSPASGLDQGRFGYNEELAKRFGRYIPLIEHYAKRFRSVKDLAWGNFTDRRIDLLAMENIWHLQAEIRTVMSAEPNPMNALLRIESATAERYLEMMSLAWQYQAMVDKFAEVKDTWSNSRKKEFLEELYRKNYVTLGSPELLEEIGLYLDFLGVPAESRKGISERAIAAIGKYDPVLFASSNGSQGVPFMEILRSESGL